ncbi:NUDIX domain-containing protein [Naasia lichenicola]|uniref:NUDIX domain-containing protein n=2 Tax=Naasia lichenicola TaxID=2565933 RepID=A0A4S4FSE0_9MICO|nr:NUDIX domain-containing protein [Naasia lichenicola]
MSRVLVFDEQDRILLFLQYGKSHDVPPRWITPGGGVDPGEDHDQAAIREMHEETGLVLDSITPPFWSRDFEADQRWHVYEVGHDEWYELRVQAFDPSREGWTEDERVDVLEYRWWTLEDLERTPDLIEPDELLDLIRGRLAAR